MDLQTLCLPSGTSKLLLHSCCAPCAGDIMHRVLSAGIDFTVYFYNPNIHPRTEYILRKDENKRFADQHQIPFIDADYDERQWFSQTRALENEPERGIRCTLCFDYRFEKTAAYAHAHRFDVMSSTLSISRWKNKAQINHSGERAAALFPNLVYWTHDWREQGGAQRMLAVSKQERFYQQEYCGCAYSFRDTNRWRKANGRDEIHRGTRFYGPDVTPEK